MVDEEAFRVEIFQVGNEGLNGSGANSVMGTESSQAQIFPTSLPSIAESYKG